MNIANNMEKSGIQYCECIENWKQYAINVCILHFHISLKQWLQLSTSSGLLE